jgi:tetratricopeptide (TPR) repeat protein
MFTYAGDGRPSRRLHNFAFTASLTALWFGLGATTVAPLWSQSPANLTFEEVEKHATDAREAKQFEEAARLYREGLRQKPSWKEGSWYLGTSLYGLKRYAEALDAFRHLAISQPGNGPAWALAGLCEFELNNYPRALEYLSRSEGVGLGQNEELASLVRFRTALLLNRAGESEQAIDRLIPLAVAGTYPEVIEALGLSLLRARLLPSEIPEQDRDLYVRAGEAMNAYVTHDSEGAARLFEELVAVYPNRPGVHYAHGAFLMESDPDKALQEFERELELNPSHANALLQMAKLYLKQGAPEKALPYARRAVQADPDVPGPHRVLGESLLASGDTAAAIQELGTAARLAPEYPQTHFLLAQAHKKAGNSALATEEMAEFERLDRKQEKQTSGANLPK